MKQALRPLYCLALLAFAFTGAVMADEAVTLEGSFVWERDEGDLDGDLTAILTPNGDNEWSVAFHFIWDDEPHTYLGTANGSLAAGALAGTADSDDPDHRISFRFEGEFEDGTFTGTHGWIKEDGTLGHAGTMTLAHPE